MAQTGLSSGVADLVSALTGGGAAIQQRAKTAEEMRMMQVQQERALLDERVQKAIAATGGNRDADLIRAEFPGAGGAIIVGNHGPSFKAFREGEGVEQKNEARRISAEIANLAPMGPDRQNAYTSVSTGKLLTPNNVQVMPQADANIDRIIAQANASNASAGAQNASAALNNARLPFVDDQAQGAIDLSAAKLANELAKADISTAKAKASTGKIDAAKSAVVEKAYRVMGKVDEALNLAGFGTTGMGADTLAGIGGTDARDLRSTLETIKANLGFDALQQMRDASPTGGALGQVAVQELVALQSTIASLDQGQDEKTLRQNLGQIREHYQRWRDTVAQAQAGQSSAAPDGSPDPDEGATATNPQTGQRIIKRGGQWVPL